MTQDYVATADVVIKAPVERVWEALITPEMVKQYLFGTQMKADWKVGGAITYTGEWEGKAYEDKGTILELQPGKKFVSTYWSSMSGMADLPENYQKVAYELSPEGEDTRLTVTQTNNRSKETADHSAQNWRMVLAKMKELLESH